MAGMNLGLAFLLLGCLALPDLKGRALALSQTRAFRRYVGWTLLLAVVTAASLLLARYAPQHPYSVREQPNFGHEAGKFIYFLIPPLLALGWVGKDFEKGVLPRFLKAFWCAIGVAGLVGVQQYFTGWPRAVGIGGYEGAAPRYAAVLLNGLTHSVISVLALAVFPLLAATLARPSPWAKPLGFQGLAARRELWLVAVILACATSVLTFARAGWVTLPLGVLLLGVWMLPARGRWAIAAALPVVGIALYQVEAFRSRFHYWGGYSDRFTLWRGHWELFKSSPWLGVGFRQNAGLVEEAFRTYLRQTGQAFEGNLFATHAHNVFLDMLAGTGILGTLVFLLWNTQWIGSWLRLARSRSHRAWRWLALGMLVGIGVFWLNGLVQENFWDSKVMHSVMLSVGLGLAFDVFREFDRSGRAG